MDSSGDWLAHDPGRLDTSLEAFAPHPAYDAAQLRADLDLADDPRSRDRVRLLLCGSDGEPLFGPPRE